MKNLILIGAFALTTMSLSAQTKGVSMRGPVFDDGPDNLISCSADINQDGAVTVMDMLRVVSQMGWDASLQQVTADVDGDGHVNIDDLMIVLAELGHICE